MDDNSESVVDVEEQPQVEEQETPEVETPEASTETEEAPKAEDDGEVEVSFGEPPVAEEKPEKESSTFREMRQANRELRQRLKELEAKTAPKVPELGPKPTMADHEYDEEKFSEALALWHSKKSQIEQQQREAQARQMERVESFQAKQASYAERKKALRVPDYADAEANVADMLSLEQQNAIIAYAENPEQLVYALGRNAANLKHLAESSDIIDFASRMARLESKLTVTSKAKKPPPPEQKITANGGGSSGKSLERALEDALKSGDASAYAKLIASKGK